MNRWNERSPETQRLLNPSFCSLLLWHSAKAHEEMDPEGRSIEFEKCFLVLPIVLHREIRESLPPRVSTSLPVWLGRNPLASSTIANRSRSLIPFTKEALRFGGSHGLLQFNETIIVANRDWERRVETSLAGTSDEVQFCARRASFIGRWFANTGNAETVLSLLGIQP